MLATEYSERKRQKQESAEKGKKKFEKKLYKEVKKNPKALYRYIKCKERKQNPNYNA